MATKSKKKAPGGVNPGRSESKPLYGSLTNTGPENRTLQSLTLPKDIDLPKNIVFNVLSAVMPNEQAKLLAGYSSGTNPCKLRGYSTTVEAIRDKLREVAGVTLADQVAWYLRASGTPENATGEQINARKQIDKLMGYEAPQKVEINERKEILIAAHTFKNFMSETGLNPMQLKKALDNAANGNVSEAEYEEVEEEDTSEELKDIDNKQEKGRMYE